ncbi:leucine--tRNA ligase [Leptobacterium sp. I13]|uniref:leucine--tRNA ligase n=1 Tax=Leptobacterium meishanense TaxID=3128904 RepID=UPI0030EECA7B
MKYNFNEIEAKWQKKWAKEETFKAENNSEKPKYYVLDMFPYPSGAGLHVGHPLGYIASDIYARFKRHQGYNVLHPMGYDSFGLPAEQYAIQTGQHPAITTETNIKRYREQLDKIGFSFDWSREVRTSDPEYYKWTQWIFIQLFNSWYNKDTDKAEDISTLIALFEKEGNAKVNAACDEGIAAFTAEEWNRFSSEEQQRILLKYRLTYLAETEVNWCPALGTVLANDEIVNGVSERGGHPVVRKKMTQWSMRISAYAERLLKGLDTIDWPEPLKESQRNWIGKSVGASVRFEVADTSDDDYIDVFTTRPDTIFGVSFMTLAPEHELVEKITTPEQKEKVQAYIEATARRSERERMADVKTISGEFTGAYAIHPFTGKKVPIWIGDYVLAGYGTGAVMAVPCGDQRDYDFAKHFGIDIPNIFEGVDISKEAFADKENTVIANSDFLNGLYYKEATKKAIEKLEEIGQGKGKTNYRLRDAVFSRQRYWGEPFPVYYVNGLPQMIDEQYLPLKLPEVEKYLPTETGEPPLGNATVWAWNTKNNEVVANDRVTLSARLTDGQAVERKEGIYPLELNTMPGWAGSSWYFNRYMDAKNPNEFASQEALNYWKDVDLYIGGSEHATGHLLYARFWQKFLFDRGYVPVDEFAKKLINQGMILGESPKGLLLPKYLDKNIGWNLIHKKGLRKDPFGQNIGAPDIVNKGGEPTQYRDWILYPIKINEIYDFGESKIDTIPYDEVGKDGAKIYITEKNIGRLRKKYAKFNNLQFGNKEHLAKLIGDKDILNKVEGLLENDRVSLDIEIEKMSKSKHNVVNPDDICEQYGADTLRLYEMFLGPLEQAKPWNTAGITGVHSFLKKLWKLYHSGTDEAFYVSEEAPSKESLKTLHKTIKKVTKDIENFSFNTSVSSFMIAVNELTAQRCNSRVILEPLAVIMAPYAPHIAEELWEKLGHKRGITFALFPEYEEKYLVESTKEYPVSFNGKLRFKTELSLDLSKEEIEKIILADERTQQQLAGRTPKKVIVVPGKIINIVG